MATEQPAVIDPATGHEDAERVTVAFLVGGAPVPDARLAGANRLWERIGAGATAFSY